MSLPLIVELLNITSSVLRDDNIKSETATAIGEAISFAARMLRNGEATVNNLSQLNTLISAMANENREPSDEEWATLKERSDDAHAVIQSFDTTPKTVSGQGSGNILGTDDTPKPATNVKPEKSNAKKSKTTK